MHQSTPMISIIIPSYNAERFLGEAIDSVLAQSYSDFEIILINDGSSDSTVEIMNSYADKYPDKIKTATQQNRGPGAARNYGMKLSRGEYLLFLDSDDLLSPTALERLVATQIEHNADIVYGDWVIFDSPADLKSDKLTVFCRANPCERRDPEMQMVMTDCWNAIDAYLFKRDFIQQIAGWDEKAKITEDSRFVLGCFMHGALFAHCHSIVVYYRQHENSSKKVYQRNERLRALTDFMDSIEFVEDYWKQKGPQTLWRKCELSRAYTLMARQSYTCDAEIFNKAYSKMRTFFPLYFLFLPKRISFFALFVGYSNAEKIAYYYRQFKTYPCDFLRAAARFLGLGKFLLCLKYIKSATALGFIKQGLCQCGDMRAISRAKPIVTNVGGVEVHMLLHHARLYEGIWGLYSFAYFCSQPCNVVVHNDGTLNAHDSQILMKVLPGCRIVMREEADAVVNQYFDKQNLVRCRKMRDTLKIAMKLFDPWFFMTGRSLILLDSDVLFFARPSALLANSSRGETESGPNLYLKDISYSHCLSEHMIRDISGHSPLILNSGILKLKRNIIDFNNIEKYLRQPLCWNKEGNADYHLEQTIFAIELARTESRPLPAEYVVCPTQNDSKMIAGHYCGFGYSHSLFYTQGIPRLKKIMMNPKIGIHGD